MARAADNQLQAETEIQPGEADLNRVDRHAKRGALCSAGSRGVNVTTPFARLSSPDLTGARPKRPNLPSTHASLDNVSFTAAPQVATNWTHHVSQQR